METYGPIIGYILVGAFLAFLVTKVIDSKKDRSGSGGGGSGGGGKTKTPPTKTR